MSTIEVLPEGLASTPPGPVLGSALASMDPGRYESVDLFGMVALQAKQVAFEQSRLLAMMLEAAYAYGGDVALAKAAVAKATVAKATSPDGLPDADGGGVGVPARVRELDEFSADQLAFSLVWSRVTAQAHLFTAKDLIERLPVVYAALRAGRIDLPRARVFSDGLACLDDVKAQEIAALLIEKAEELTPGQLREKVHYRVIKADPSLVRKRYDRCVADRSVYNQPYADGTSHLSAVNLPPDKAAAAYNRVDRIARAAKSSGDVRTLPQLRADALLDLLSGRPFMLSPSLDNVTAAADQAARNLGYSNDDPDDLAGSQPPPTIRDRHGTRTARGGTARASTSGPASGSQAASDRESFATGAAGTGRGAGPAGGAGDGAQAGSPAQPGTGPDDEGLSDQDIDDAGGRYVSVDPDPIGVAAFESDPRPDDQPYPDDHHYPDDYLHPDSDAADQRPRDDSPNPTVTNPTTRSLPIPVASDDPRQCVCGGIQPAPRRGVVDLQMQLSTLMSLNDDPAIIPGWGPILADIARQVAYDQETNPAWKFSITDPNGNLLHHGHIRRRPNATEAAFVKARNGSCFAPGCRQPATICDLDHRQEWANKGPSHRGNLDPACKHHHRLRHEHGFRIHHIHGGTYIWEAPNGMLYRVLPDASLMFPVHSDEPGPPHGYVNQYFPDEPLEDAYGRP